MYRVVYAEFSGLWDRILPPIFISCDFCFLSVVPAPDRAVPDRGIDSDFPVFGLMIETLFHISCRWKSVHFSPSSVLDINVCGENIRIFPF